MKKVTTTEFRKNLATYIWSGEEIIIINNKREVGRFIPKYVPKKDK